MEDEFSDSWLPTYATKTIFFKTKLCLELITKNSQKKFWFKIKVDPPSTSWMATYDQREDVDSSKVLKRTNPFLTHSTVHESFKLVKQYLFQKMNSFVKKITIFR